LSLKDLEQKEGFSGLIPLTESFALLGHSMFGFPLVLGVLNG
jgi:hypothetical protein